ncbi:MAG: hypothetical protein ACI83I_001576 [Bacteroidia bacterium]|jgi:hypothetical protein
MDAAVGKIALVVQSHTLSLHVTFYVRLKLHLMKTPSYLILLISSLSIVGLLGCDESNKTVNKPDAMGELADMVVFTDQLSWNELGDEIDSIFTQSIPGMAGSNPFFKCRHAHETIFDGYLRNHFNIFVFLRKDRWEMVEAAFGPSLRATIVEKFPTNGVSVFTLHDVWASPQVVHFVLTQDGDQLKKNLRAKKSSYLVQALEAEHVSTITSFYDAKILSDSAHGDLFANECFSLKVPGLFKTAIKSGVVNGFRRQMGAKYLGLNYFSEPYTGLEQLTQSAIIARRNNVLGNHVKGADYNGDTAQMSTDTVNVEVFRRIYDRGDLTIIETRGWWEFTNPDFKAGPFINHTIVCNKTKTLVSLDGFVFAPGEDKNKLMRQLEMILYTFREK